MPSRYHDIARRLFGAFARTAPVPRAQPTAKAGQWRPKGSAFALPLLAAATFTPLYSDDGPSEPLKRGGGGAFAEDRIAGKAEDMQAAPRAFGPPRRLQVY